MHRNNHATVNEPNACVVIYRKFAQPETDILGWWHSIVGYRHNSVTHQNIITFFCFRAPRIGPVNDVEMMEMVDEVKGLFEI